MSVTQHYKCTCEDWCVLNYCGSYDSIALGIHTNSQPWLQLLYRDSFVFMLDSN